MSKDGRIGFRAALQRLAEALQMEGVRRMPQDVDLDVVRIVQPLLPSTSPYTLRQLTMEVPAFPGTVGATVPIIQSSDAPFTLSAGQTDPLDNSELETIIIAAHAQVNVDDAVVAAMVAADSYLRVRWLTGSGAPSGTNVPARLTAAQRLAFRNHTVPRDETLTFSLYGGGLGGNIKADISSANQTPGDVSVNGPGHQVRIPSRCGFAVDVFSEPGIVFAAPSSLSISATLATGPKGFFPW